MATPVEVVFMQRKPRPGNFSLEFIFEDVRNRLKNKIHSLKLECPDYSNGLLDRVRNILFMRKHQGMVNHVTGDVLYLSYLLDKKRSILTIPDCVFMKHPKKFKRAFLWFFWLYLPVQRTGCITAISQATKEDILRHVDCNPDKIRVIPVAISPTFIPDPKPFNAAYPTILHVGAAPNKNLDRLMEAIKDIPCRLSIVGKITPSQHQRLKELGIDYVNEWGLDSNGIIAKYQECDMLAFVSTYEGFGMPIVEANAIERPVVTSRVASMPEVAGDAACLVDPFDIASIREGILKVIKDGQYRNQLIENGRKNRERFDPEHIALLYYELYREVAWKANHTK